MIMRVFLSVWILLTAVIHLSECGHKKKIDPSKVKTTAMPTVSSERLKRLLELQQKFAERAASRGIGGNPFQDLSTYFQWQKEFEGKQKDVAKIKVSEHQRRRGMIKFNPYGSTDNLRTYWKWQEERKKKQKSANMRMLGNGTTQEEEPAAANMKSDGDNPYINDKAFLWMDTACSQGQNLIKIVDIFKQQG